MAKAKKKTKSPVKYEERAKNIVSFLGDGMSTNEIATKLKLDPSGVCVTVRRMLKDGLIVKGPRQGRRGHVYTAKTKVATKTSAKVVAKTNGVTKHYEAATIHNLRVKVPANTATRFRAFVQKNGFNEEQEAKFFGAYIEQAMNNFEDPLYSAKKRADEAMRQLGVSVVEIGKAEA
jgi:transposase